MAGGRSSGEATYVCTRSDNLDVARCTRRINAASLEFFVSDAAVELLTGLDITGAPTATIALSEIDQATISADEQELAELKDMWTQREIPTREYRQHGLPVTPL